MSVTNRNNREIYLLILFGIIFRMIMAIIHFTHWDDIGVANFIIELSQITESDMDIVKRFSEFWTYAPLQIFFSKNLVNENMSYALNVFMGRIPSLACGILYVIVIYQLMYKMKSDEKYTILLIVSIISLSWENIIYSAQMEPYSMGLLFSAIILYSVINNFYDTWDKTLWTTLMFSIGCYAQYQIFILVFVAYIVTFIGNMKNRKNAIRVLFAGVVNFLSSMPLLIFLFSSGKLSQSINWNAGKNDMFSYQIVGGGGYENVKYAIIFWIRNIFLCFKYLFLANSFDIIANILTVILMICAGLGVYYIHHNKEYKLFAFFHDLLALIFVVMVTKGSLTLGPSRHILFIEPLWILLIYFGIIQLSNIKTISFYRKKIVITITFLVITLFVFSIPNEVASRRNLISEKYLCHLMEKYNPRFVFSEGSLDDLFLVDIDGFSNHSMSLGNGWLQSPDIDVSPHNNDNIILMSKYYTIEDLKDNENRMKQQLLERINSFNLDIKWGDLDSYTIVYKKEIQTDAEVEYARKYYWNHPNGLCLYVLKYNVE